METNQTAQMVSWLDEERRKDKAIISRLEERSTSQMALIEEQTRRIQELEAALTGLQSKLLTTTMFEDTVSRLRTEFTTGVEQIETRRTGVDQDMKKMRDMDREALMKAIEDVRQEVTTRIDRAIQPRRAEEERLGKVAKELQSYADTLSKGLEEFERSLAFLEEQRRQDTRRISDLNGEVADLAKRAESQQAKIELLEELSRRNERAVGEMTGTINEFKQQRQAEQEQQALLDQQRERTMNEMVQKLDSFAEDMVSFEGQVSGWAETHRKIKQQTEDFERIADRVDRRLSELAEMQRLSEERFRQEWEDIQGDEQKRWRQFTLTNEESWRENGKTLDEIQGQLTQVSERLERQIEHIKHLGKVQQDSLVVLAERYQALREQSEDGRGALPSLT